MDNLVTEGLSLMVYGMGFVFVFLTLLVFTTNLMSNMVTKYVPEPVAEPRAMPVVKEASTNNDELLAVISAAVHHHRSK